MDDRRLARLHRRLRARECMQAVIRLPNDKFDLMPASSPRFLAMLGSELWAAQVVGVFSPDIDYSVLCEEVS